MSVSADGMLLCTTADDKSLKVFDVINFGKHHSSIAGVIMAGYHLCRHDQHVSSQVCSLLLCVALCWRSSNSSGGMVSSVCLLVHLSRVLLKSSVPV